MLPWLDGLKFIFSGGDLAFGSSECCRLKLGLFEKLFGGDVAGQDFGSRGNRRQQRVEQSLLAL